MSKFWYLVLPTVAILLVTTVTLPMVADAQVRQTWDIHARQQAERFTSAGISLLQKRQIDTALTAFEKATVADPSDPNPFTMIGLTLAMKGRLDEALHALQRSYSLKQSSEALLATGVVYYLKRDFEAAINSWNRAASMSRGENCRIHGALGFAFLRLGQFSNAQESFDKLVKCHPTSQLGYQGLAMTRYLRGEFRGARAAAERAESIQPYPPAVLLLAKVDALQGDRATALTRAHLFNRLSRRSPDRRLADFGFAIQHDFRWDPFKGDNLDNGYLLMARLQSAEDDKKRASLAEQGDASAVMETALSALQDSENDLFLTRDLGLAQLSAGQYAAAADTFKRVVERYPNCHVDLLHIARALALGGKGAEGAEYVRQFQSNVPGQQLSPVFSNIGQAPPSQAECPPEEPEPTPKAIRKPKITKPKPAASPAQRPGAKKGEEVKPIPASEF